MKVLHVTATGRRRGGEVFASDLTRWLRRRGIEQRVLVLRSSSVDVEFGVPVLPASSDEKPRPIVPRALSVMRSSVGMWQPDVIQAHGGEALKHAVLSGTSNESSLVYRRIGGASGGLESSRLRRWAYRRMMSRAARVVTVADALRDETIEAFRLPEEQVVTIPNGVDPARIHALASRGQTRSELGLSADHRVLLSMGSISWEKDPGAHLAASALVMEHDPRAAHVFVGDGPLRRQVEGEAFRMGLGGRHRFLGQRADVGDLMNACDVLLFASRPDGMEGMPAVLIEAGMAGLPVAAFDVAGVSEIVEHGATGYLVPWRDVDGLAAASLRLLGDAGMSDRFSVNARQHAARFEIERIGGRYLDLYSSLLVA